MPSTRIPLTLSEVQLEVPGSVGIEAGMVVLTELQPPGRMLRIIIGQPEAKAIMAAWQGAVPGRPATWDLLLSTIELLGARVEKIVIHAVEEERHYFAMIELSQGGEPRTLSCRPSDAIALAVRAFGSQILAEEAVLDAAGVLADGTRPPPREKVSDASAGYRGAVVGPGQAQALGVPQAAAPTAQVQAPPDESVESVESDGTDESAAPPVPPAADALPRPEDSRPG